MAEAMHAQNKIGNKGEPNLEGLLGSLHEMFTSDDNIIYKMRDGSWYSAEHGVITATVAHQILARGHWQVLTLEGGTLTVHL